MTPERWQQIDNLFDEVLEISEAKREDFLNEKCVHDENLKQEVLSLLKAHAETENFIENSAINIVTRRLAKDYSDKQTDSFIGKTIGSFKVKKLIGEGGMGEVYLADDEKLKRHIALKILPIQYTTDDERVHRLAREAQAISALNHPNIVTIHDVGKFETTNYIATEFVEGKTIREIIKEDLSLREILNIVIQCCEALVAAHNAGIIHRDIKPENIMVRPDGYVKILDFGLAKLTEPRDGDSEQFAETLKGTIMGTPAYMSPEQASGTKVDNRTDLWSIGVVFYELLTGVNPFKRENRQATIQAILQETPKLPSSINPQIPGDIDNILIKALEKDPDLSYQTASGLIADFKRVKRELTSSSSWSGSNSNMGQKKSFSNPLKVIVPVFCLLIVGIGGWFIYQNFFSNAQNVSNEWKSAKNLQITNTIGVDQYPSLSPDGKFMVFTTSVDNRNHIFWQRVGGGKSINLTKDSDSQNSMAVYSPDGKTIAFRSSRNPSGIYLMEETGENVRRVSDMGFHPSWSPDGKKLVVSDGASDLHTFHTTPNSLLWTIDLESGEKKKLETGGDAIFPNWSPNGHRIAFWFVKEGKLGDIATIPADGGEPVIVTDNVATDWNPIWSHDGKFIYFASDRGGNMGLWRVAVDEKSGKVLGEPETIPTPAKYCRHLTISNDGKLLGYVRYESQSNLKSMDFDFENEKILGEPKWITKGNREISLPDLSPNGEEFVIREPSLVQEDLVIYDKNGVKKRYLTKNRFNEREPRWSPDGEIIYFHSNSSGRYQIWSIKKGWCRFKAINFYR